MKKFIVSLVSLAITLLPWEIASGYGHANRYGGSTSHSYGSTSHTNAYGGSSSHTYGEGTTHSNVYGGTTTGAYGAGAVHTGPYGATAYHPPAAGYYGE